MNLIIEIIDGVAYAVLDQAIACKKCAVYNQCDYQCLEHDGIGYRHLTADERVAVQEALGRGVELNDAEYDYSYEWKLDGDISWIPSSLIYWTKDTVDNATRFLKESAEKNGRKLTVRVLRRPSTKWEEVK